MIAALTAAAASAASITFSLPVWAMFVGWIAFYTKGLSVKAGIENQACAGVGLFFGLCSALAISSLSPVTGLNIVLPIVVFFSALIAVSLRGLPFMNNLSCYFLGLVTWFAAHLEYSLQSLLLLFNECYRGLGWWSATWS
ncbi:DUF1097 domain-containing protein [Thalassomonas haliotis]|uniref:DUF1097 domain-containing protein n=1 Tax=Thalassomonas haliotis TaxID=485448 RepID=A0ABY7V975_9GAMM|nr:DUF1097 domain-containing protein [Thalassomonas haliotis]WDE10189.1 DUF1097 domain-containing protein [Thalassomonas haliotis]